MSRITTRFLFPLSLSHLLVTHFPGFRNTTVYATCAYEKRAQFRLLLLLSVRDNFGGSRLTGSWLNIKTYRDTDRDTLLQ